MKNKQSKYRKAYAWSSNKVNIDYSSTSGFISLDL